MKKIVIGALATLVLVSGVFTAGSAAACGWFSSCSNENASDLQQTEQQKITNNQKRLEDAVGIPTLNNSLERANISKRLTSFNDPNKVTYIYLVSFGKVMSFYTVKGKVTSGGKRLTSSQRQLDSQNCGSGNCGLVMESPELDGTYGSSNPYIYFWTTDGAYIQWSGDYMQSDQPLKLATQPELTRAVQ